MTNEMDQIGPSIPGYWAQVKAWGLTVLRDVGERHVLCQDREGQIHQVRKPDDLSPQERADALRELKARLDPFGALQ